MLQKKKKGGHQGRPSMTRDDAAEAYFQPGKGYVAFFVANFSG